MMQLLDLILVSVFLVLSFPTARAIPREKPRRDRCPNPPKSFSSLPGNFSLEVLFPYDQPELEYDRPVVRIFTEGGGIITVPEIGQPQNGSTVFQLKDQSLIPVGGPAARVLDPKFASDSYNGRLGSFVFDTIYPFGALVKITATEACDAAGNVVRTLTVVDYLGDGGGTFLSLYSDPYPPREISIIRNDYKGKPFGIKVVLLIKSLTRAESEKNYKLSGQASPPYGVPPLYPFEPTENDVGLFPSSLN